MKKFAAKFILTATALILSASVAFAAMTLEDAKHSGLIGEQPDGLVGVVSGASPDAKSLVESTNAQRLEKYKAIADKHGSSLDQVQAVAGQKLIASTPAGEYVKSASGSWQKK
ncbi:MAG: YdbL family protein [Micavibrio sp.]|nr:YdbL family protein [Micavibrio sp.]